MDPQLRANGDFRFDPVRPAPTDRPTVTLPVGVQRPDGVWVVVGSTTVELDASRTLAAAGSIRLPSDGPAFHEPSNPRCPCGPCQKHAATERAEQVRAEAEYAVAIDRERRERAQRGYRGR